MVAIRQSGNCGVALRLRLYSSRLKPGSTNNDQLTATTTQNPYCQIPSDDYELEALM
jgi:hypothetical protein